MNLNLLRILVRVVQAGSFTAAAKSLSMPTSSVSRAVAQLEDDLGVRLLDRTTRRLSLTEAGRGLFEVARRSLEDLEEAAAGARDEATTPKGWIRVTGPPNIGPLVFQQMIPKFLREYPETKVEVAITRRKVDLVAEGFDLALRTGTLEDSSLVSRRVGTYEIFLAATPSYLKRHGRPETLADLARHECVLCHPNTDRTASVASEYWTLVGPDGPVQVVLTGRVVFDDPTYASDAVVAGVGIGMVPAFSAQLLIEKRKLSRVLPEHSFRSGMFIVLPSSRLRATRVVKFCDMLASHLAKR